MRRVLLTGATGFDGSHAIPALSASGYEIHAVGRSDPGHPEVMFHAADLLDAAATQAVVTNIHASHLLHLAWYAEPGLYWQSPVNLDWVSASIALVRAFHAAGGTRAVVAGTCAEYAWSTDRLREDATCAPETLYGAAKDSLRRVIEAYAQTTGLSFAWGRLFYLYGPGEKPGRLVSDAVRSLRTGKRFATSSGLQRRDFLYVEDVAEAFASILGSKARGAVNIGSGVAVPVRDILLGLAEFTGGVDQIAFGSRPIADTEPACIEADVGRLRDEVGFTQRRTLSEGLSATVKSYENQGG